jgi:anti-sigma regulatory factor (Ser/Thr protein kinase)
MTVEAQEMMPGAIDHAVHFYEEDSDLASTVRSYLVSAIQGGEVALVIATPDHRRIFEQAMTEAGIDVPAAQRAGGYVALDAAGTMSAFMEHGRIDGGSFGAVIGPIIRDAIATGRPVRAYGEMVALLWDAGDVLGAIELEGRWNDLQQEVPFGLLCAYPTSSVSGSEHGEALGAVCHLHSAVSSSRPAQAEREFPAELAAPRAARSFLVGALRQWGCDHLVDDAVLVLSELVTNAVVHTAAPFRVVIRAEDRSVRVAVYDRSPDPPTRRSAHRLAVSGRGLGLVASLASRWGTHKTAAGKVVWAEFV